MAMSAGGGRGVQSEINVTPLVDVVLVLLIIFMVATPILQMGLDVEVPPKVEVTGPPPEAEQEQLVVTVRQNGIFLNQQNLGADPTALRNKLAPILVGRAAKDRIVFINGENNMTFDRIVAAMDASHQAGAQKIGFLTEPPE